MHYEYSYIAQEGMGLLAGLISGFPAMALHIAGYVLTALALYALAHRRGIRNPWLAWIPVVNCWLIGSLSDQYRYLVKGQIKSRRKLLLVLSILISALAVVLVVLAAAAAVNMFMGIRTETFGLMIALVILGLALGGIAIWRIVLRFMALHDIFRSMDPENGTLFLVLSILFPVTEPFFLFFNRNRELGMPPRREETQYQPPQEPWEQESFL